MMYVVLGKIHIPLSFVFFFWLLRRYSFKSKVSNTTVQHLLFNCHYTKFICRKIIRVFFNLKLPINVQNMLTDWLEKLDRKIEYLILMGVSLICWAI